MRRFLFAFSVAVLGLPQAANRASTNEKPKVIELVADQDDRFKLLGQDHQDLVLKAGEDVILRVNARFGGMRSLDGSVHGLVVRNLRNQGWNFRLKEGMQDLHVTAPATPGVYRIECSVVCGPGHQDMQMKMVVEP